MTAYQRAKEKKQREAPILIRFVNQHLEKDMIVSFKGTNGPAFRKIVEIRNITIVGLVISYHRTKKEWILSGGASENGIENLKGYFADDGQFITRKQILEQHEETIE